MQIVQIIEPITDWIKKEAALQKDSIFLWVPVFFAIGIGTYFSLPIEPPLILCLLGACLGAAVHFLIHAPSIRFISLIVLLFLCGFTASKIRTETIKTPILETKTRTTKLIGTVVAIEDMEEGGGSRIILSDLEIERIPIEKTPRKVRLRLRKDAGIEVGQRIQALALLNPPSPPLMPEGFDFRRYLYFQGIGAVGFIFNAPEILQQPHPSFFNSESLRHRIAARIKNALTPQQSSIAMALIVGQKGALSDADRQAVRDAGLAHMLAISGLHVGLLAGALFFILRLGMALFPALALQYPIKKIAAVFALCGAIFYMMLAGATIPTQRAVLMTAIVFLAIILDRSPISLRLVAFSALIVLIIAPESLLSASFHMSFAAVTCLIYFYDRTRVVWKAYYEDRRWWKKPLLYFISVCITTIIASLATSPFALYHFGQVSFLGSLANLVAVPLLAFIIMPFALMGVVLMPVGLDYWPLRAMAIGIDYMLDIAYWAASLPASIIYIPAWGFIPFLSTVLSVLCVILWKGWGKLFIAIPFIFASLILTSMQSFPDILISSTHKLMAFKMENALAVSSRRSDRFTLENWEKYYGLPLKSSELLPYKGENKDYSDFYACGEEGCRFEIKNHKVSFLRSAYAIKQDCSWADILISTSPVSKAECKSTIIIDKFDTWKNGAYTIWITHDLVKIKTVAQNTASRPWSAYKN